MSIFDNEFYAEFTIYRVDTSTVKQHVSTGESLWMLVREAVAIDRDATTPGEARLYGLERIEGGFCFTPSGINTATDLQARFRHVLLRVICVMHRTHASFFSVIGPAH